MFRVAAFAALAVCMHAYSIAGEPAPPAPVEKPMKNAKEHKYTNALAKETSPYLLQHAHNPVNWFPWGTEAFAKAKKENKPVFLSVGYSSCHWCHVMERESFENEDVAKILNEHFVSIKVDREERPDVDEIYMAAVQAVTQRGGWPMSVFMTAEGKPFFGGTYFPPEDKFGRMGFKSLLAQVNKVWKEKHAEVLRDAETLSDAVRQSLTERKIKPQWKLGSMLLENAATDLHENFDAKLGGFGRAPKFPPNNGLPLLLALVEKKLDTDAQVRQMVTLTLDQMAMGGMHDQIGGGFHRYSTDEKWLLPHFEKMLYDNAMLARSYAEASRMFQNPEYERVARDTYDWVLREMTAPDGGFYSSFDADSEGEEGKFYVWSRNEILATLSENLLREGDFDEKDATPDALQFCEIFNIKPEGNYREEATGHATKLNIPHLTAPLSEHATHWQIKEEDLRKKLDAAKAKLLAVRVKRIWPGLDDKVLTAWNGLMISSFARGAKVFNEPRYRQAAIHAAEFALKNQRTAGGRWLATHRKGESKLPAYLDDHAFMAGAFLDLFELTGETRWKDEAIAIVRVLDTHFADKEGGYFFTSDDHEKLLARTKDPVDRAIPSGNGWAAQTLVRLAKITGDQSYRAKAVKIFEEFQGLMERAPQATESLLLALALHFESAPPESVAAEADTSATRGAVSVEVFAGRSAFARGVQSPIAVRFKMKGGFHIQEHGGKEGMIAATRISLAGKKIGKLAEEKYPAATEWKAPGGETLKFYSGVAVVLAKLELPADAPLGKTTVLLKVKFQACNDEICEAPQEVLLGLPIEVVEKDAGIVDTNKEIFEKK